MICEPENRDLYLKDGKNGKEQRRRKDDLKMPKLSSRSKFNLSDIIAATIGEDVRSCDQGYHDYESEFTSRNSSNLDNIKETTYPAKSTTDLLDSTLGEGNPNLDFVASLFADNSNNACDSFSLKHQQTGLYSSSAHNESSHDSNSHSSFATVPNFQAENSNSNTMDSVCNELSTTQNMVTSSIPTDFGDLNFSFDTSVGFDSHFNSNTDFLANLCEPKTSWDQNTPTVQIVPEVTGPKPSTDAGLNIIDSKCDQSANLSYDSDLEDSMHFVDPDEHPITKSFTMPEVEINHIPKKRRLSEIDSNTCPFPTGLYANNSQPDLLTLLYGDSPDKLNQSFNHRQKVSGINRTRSFSGNISHGLKRNHGSSKLNDRSANNSFKTPTIGRHRSFSEAYKPKETEFSPLSEGQFNTSFTSLLVSPPENSPLSNNPIFSDLRSTLLSDCQSTDVPKALFETLSSGSKLDVYGRERNIQSKFSSLQSKYPDEVRELSSFYRSQSAEVETERFREIHDDNMPISYRNHLNRYYDNQLHMIMDRVEKSLSLLSIAKREIVTINRTFRPRPLLSRKAVNMMEEWYTRNYEHPYPGPTAVEALAMAGEISPEQVKKWFANKRNRSKNTKPVTEVANMKRKRQFSSRW